VDIVSTVSPLIASVTVNNTTVNNELIDCTLTLAGDGRASTFDITLADNDNQYNTLVPGNNVAVSVAKSVASLTTIFQGVVERTKRKRPDANVTYLTLSGTDYSTNLLNKIVTAEYHSDTAVRLSGWSVSEIIDDLMTTYAPDITTNNVTAVSSTIIPDIVFNYQPLSDCVRELADYAPLFTFYVDGNKDLHFFFEEGRSSGITLDGTNIRSFDVETDIQNTKNYIYIIGGDELKIDVNNDGVGGGSVTTYDFWRAVQFQPTETDLKELRVYVSKDGNPTMDLDGEIREDNGSDSPSGSLIQIFQIPKSRILNAGFYSALINFKPLNTAQKHWLILYSSGGDASNTYNWFHDGGSSGTIATSVDGVTWSTSATTYTLASQTVYAQPLLFISQDDDSVTKYGQLETVIAKPTITRRDQAELIGQKHKKQYARARKEFRLSIVPPDQIINPGETVTIVDTPTNTSGSFLVTQTEYHIRGYETYDMSLRAFGTV
jgi:hypothetical protein